MADTETTEVATTETSITEGNEEAATYVSMMEMVTIYQIEIPMETDS